MCHQKSLKPKGYVWKMNMKANVNKRITLNAIPSLRNADSRHEFNLAGLKADNFIFIVCIRSGEVLIVCYFFGQFGG